MTDQRFGTDLNVAWSLFHETKPYNLEGQDITLYLKDMYGKRKIDSFSVRENNLSFTFYGKDQKLLGVHSLELIINEGKEGMVTIDKCKFVNLVDCSCHVGGTQEANVKVETIELTSTLEFIAGASTEELNEILSAVCSIDFNNDFNNDFSTGF